MGTVKTNATEAAVVTLSEALHEVLYDSIGIRWSPQVMRETTTKMVPGKNSGCTLAVIFVPNILGHVMAHSCSQLPTGRNRKREMSKNAATSTYGIQAFIKLIDPL